MVNLILAALMLIQPVAAVDAIAGDEGLKPKADKIELGTDVDWQAYKNALMTAQKKSGAKTFISDKAAKIWLQEAIKKHGGADKVKPEDIEKIWQHYIYQAKAKARS